MNQPLLKRRSPVGISYALLILFGFFFLLPSAFRAARLSLGKKENNVKDWLPDDFPETAELEWFADHFVGESFVVATWPGCSAGDKRLRLLEEKLIRESESFDPSSDVPDGMKETYLRARRVGKELQLLLTGDDHRNWGGLDEKWLTSPTGQWYYITPDGRLYRWDKSSSGPAAAGRAISRSLFGPKLEGQFLTAFGEAPVSKVANPFYNNPALLTAPLFATVETGESIVDELAQEGGALWPIDLTDEDRRAVVAQRRAMKRLTGTLFAPAVPKGFAWTAESFREAVPADRRSSLPEDFDFIVRTTVEEIVESRFGGDTSQLQAATINVQADVWYDVFDAVEVEPPPRMTCVLVTLTEVAKKHLAFALGRGVMGGPHGRLLQLAEASGVSPAPPPSMAPPPFDRKPAAAKAGVPPLRLGGPPVDNQAIDEEGTVTLVRLVGYSVLLGVVLSYLCFGSVKITIMVFVVGGSSAMLSMAMVWWTNGQVDAILMSMPSLVYVLGLSGAIHVINYYRDEVRARGEVGAAGRALRHAALPCTLASVTTAIGLVSLFTSNLAPISNFGLYSAIGVIATLAILFSYLPAALETFRPAVATRNASDATSGGDGDDPTESILSRGWAAAGRWITGHHAIVSTVCLLGLVVTSVGIFKIETSVQLLKLFDPESRVIEDYAWLEDNFGKLVPMELVLRVPPQTQWEIQSELAKSDASDPETEPDQPAAIAPLRMLERAEAVSRISKVVRRSLGETGLGVVGQTISADTFLKPFPAPTNRYNSFRAIYNEDLNEGRDQLLGSDYLRIEESGPYAGSELWRISLRVGALSDVDYGRFISTLRTTVEPVIRAYDTRDALIHRMTTDEDGQSRKLSDDEWVLFLGSQSPASLDEIEVVSVEDEQINTDNIYLATLGELVAGEKIKTPAWLDPAKSEKLEIGGERWEKILSAFDVIVWVGGEGILEEHLASAKSVIDARQIIDKPVQPVLTSGRIPDVVGADNLQVVYTGVIPVVYKAQRTLLNSLANSIGLAFVLIAAVMIVLLNPGHMPVEFFRPSNIASGLAAGMVSMVPNVFPVLLVFGVMCHYGIEIDIGTMMTASVAMGVAVDDTIHFLSWFRAYLDRGLNRVDAVIETYRRVGPAMTQTTIVGGLGLFVFALSTFTPTQRFGTLMLIMLGAALIGDLVLLPALLAGPVGRFFKPRTGLPRTGLPKDRHSDIPNNQEPGSAEQTDTPVEDGSPSGDLEPPQEPDPSQESEQGAPKPQEESLPQLRIHYPAGRPPARRLK